MTGNVTMFFLRRPLNGDPFSTFGNKRDVYYRLFERGSESGLDMFVASGLETYRPTLVFTDSVRYENGGFERFGPLTADAVFDRSGGVSFPPEDISEKTLNSAAFKRLCHDKNAMYALLGDMMPRNCSVRDPETLQVALGSFGRSDMIVLKPSKGMQGKGILFGTRESITPPSLDSGTEYALQEFIDTSKGIDGIVDGLHDLRVIIADGDMVLCHVRTPKPGSLLANVAQGGAIREVPLGSVPPFVMEAVREVQDRIDKSFDFPLYSIDFGIRNGREAFIFELNDQIGFPSTSMSHEAFIDGIIRSLKKRAAKSVSH